MVRGMSSLLLHAMLALVVVTMASPGVVNLDESDSATAGEELNAANQAPKRYPSDGHVPGRADQIKPIITRLGKEAKLDLVGKDLKHWENTETVKHAERIAKGEVSPEYAARLIKAEMEKLEKKATAAKNGHPEEEPEKSKEEEEATPSVEQIYHGMLDRLSTKAKLNLHSSVRTPWLKGHASRLASEESSAAFSSTLREQTIKQMQKRATELSEQAGQKEEVLRTAQAEQANEMSNKDKVAAGAREMKAADHAVQTEEMAAESAKMKADKASKKYSKNWLKLKENSADLRRAEAKASSSQVKLHNAEARQKAAAAELRNAEQTAEELRSTGDAKQASQAAKVEMKARDKATKADNEAAAVAKENEQSASQVENLKVQVEQQKAVVDRSKAYKELTKNNLERAATVVAQTVAKAEQQKQGFESEIARATSVKDQIKVLSATHYCAMKKRSKTGEWESVSAGYKGSETEAGNESDEAAKACDGKSSCEIAMPKADDGCPSSGYIARFTCSSPVGDELSLLLQMGEDSGVSTPTSDSDDGIEKALKKLGATLGAGTKPTSLEALEAQVSAVETSSDTQEKVVLEAVMHPGKPVQILELSCPEPKVSKTVENALKKADKAEEILVKDKAAVKKSAEDASEKAEEKLQAAKEAEAKAQKVARKEESDAEEAQTAVDSAKSKVKDAEEKLGEARANSDSKDSVKKEVAEATLKRAKQEVQAAETNAKIKAANAATAKVAADAAIKARRMAEEDANPRDKGAASPELAQAERKQKQAEDKVAEKEQTVDTLKTQLQQTDDSQKITQLTARITKAVKEEAKAKSEEKKAAQAEEQAAEESQNTEVEKKVADKAQKEIAEAELKKAELKAESASSGKATQQQQQEIKAEEEKIKQAKEAMNDAKSKEARIKQSTEAAAKKVQERKVADAKEAVEVSERSVAQLKGELASTKSSDVEQVLQLTTKLATARGKVKQAQNKEAEAEKSEAALLSTGSKAQSAVDKAEDEAAELDQKISLVKQQMSSTTKSTKVKALANKLENLESEHNKAVVAAAKAKAKIEESPSSVLVAPSKDESVAVKKDVKVIESKEEANIANMKKQAADKELKQVSQEQMQNTKAQMKETVAQDEQAAEEAQSEAASAVKQVQELKNQAEAEKKQRAELEKIKTNALKGQDATEPEKQEEEKPRSELAAAQAVKLLGTITPGSGTCAKGLDCCLNSFVDTNCGEKTDRKPMCTTSEDSDTWQVLTTASLEIHDKSKSVSFETRWVKDSTEAPDNVGSILRLRVCGQLAGDEVECFPQQGAGFKFEDYFNTPAGQCIQASDVQHVSKSALRATIIKAADRAKSSKTAAKQDAVQQVQEQEQATKNSQKKATKGEDILAQLVTELLETQDGEMVSSPMMSLKGSFMVTTKKAPKDAKDKSVKSPQ